MLTLASLRRRSAQTGGGWLPWRWTAPSGPGTSPPAGEWNGPTAPIPLRSFSDITSCSLTSLPVLLSLVDCFLVAMAPVGVSLSPTGDFLATAHVDSLGIYLWSEPISFLCFTSDQSQFRLRSQRPIRSLIICLLLLRTNKSLCGPVGLRPLPADYQPAAETLPGATAEESEQEVTSEEADDAYQSAEQLGAELVTLSLLPESRWKSLLQLDAIKVSQLIANRKQFLPAAIIVLLLTANDDSY